MTDKFQILNFKFLILLALVTCALLLVTPPLFAQTNTKCDAGTGNRAQGLVSTPNISAISKFKTSGACVSDPKAAFVPFRIPNYADLKSIYYTQSKATKATQLKGNNNDYIYNTTGDLTIDSPSDITGNNTGLIFVDGNLSITKDFKNNNSKSGTVFIVGGNIIIDSTVTQIDAVLISSGFIYTGVVTGQTNCTTSSVATLPLNINGSLISLNSENPIKFCRKLQNNNSPVEIITTQPKYLVILKDLMSDTYQKWSEIP